MSSSTGPGNAEVFTMDWKTWWEVQQILINEAPTRNDAEFLLKNMTDANNIISRNTTLCQTVLAGNISEAYQILRQQMGTDDSARILPHEQQDVSFFRALRRTQDAWTAPYVGKADQIFHAAIIDESAKFNGKLQKEFSQDYYAKVMPVVQSSGAGKSRLLDRYSTKHLGLTYTFRTGTQTGYPPGDPEILEVLHSTIPKTKMIQRSMEHATAVALIGSTVSELIAQVEATPLKDRPVFPAAFHRRMAPVREQPNKDPRGNQSAYISATRSKHRKRFCYTVRQNTEMIVERLRLDKAWMGIFTYIDASNERKPKQLAMIEFEDMQKNCIVKEVLLEPVNRLLSIQQSSGMTNVNDPLQLFLALDEVSNLVDRGSGEPTVLIAFRRVMHLLRAYPIWAFVLSTQRPLHHDVPATAMDSSSRISPAVCGRVPPFISFTSDLGLTESRLRDVRNKQLAHFSSVQHITKMGRPLWHLCEGMSASEARIFVLNKLLCGAEYNPSEVVILFAVLSYRVALDSILNSLESNFLEEHAVASHLRWISQARARSGFLHTVTLEEPIVSEAAAALFSSLDAGSADAWISTIEALYRKICCPGLIDRSRTAELWWRVISIMGSDQVPRAVDVHTESHPENSHFLYARPFEFVEYIEALFTSSSIILDTPANITGDGKAGHPRTRAGTVRSLLRHAVCNFNHYVSTSKSINPDTIDDLLHQLLFSQAALQLAPCQPLWDALIPIYNGSVSEPFDSSKIAVFLIQVQNKDRKTDLDVIKSQSFYADLFRDRLVLSVLVDFDSQRTECLPQPSYKSTTWAFRIVGRHHQTYQCFPSSVMGVVDSILQSEPTDSALESLVSNYNQHFDHHSWTDRMDVARVAEFIEGSSEKGGKKRRVSQISESSGQNEP